MDLIDRNELNKKILNLMQNYVGDDWSDGVNVCGKILQIIADMETEERSCPNTITYPPGVRGNNWEITGAPREFLYTKSETESNNASDIKTENYDAKKTERIFP